MERTALVVDDEPAVRTVVSQALTLWGWDCDEAENGAQALEAVDRRDYGLVVTDLIMPEVGGVELIRHLQSDHPDAMIVAITGRASTAAKVRLRQQCVPVLEKPFQMAQLKAALDKLESGQKEPAADDAQPH